MNDVRKMIHDSLNPAAVEIGSLFKKEGYGDQLLPRDTMIYHRFYNANRTTVEMFYRSTIDFMKEKESHA